MLKLVKTEQSDDCETCFKHSTSVTMSAQIALLYYPSNINLLTSNELHEMHLPQAFQLLERLISLFNEKSLNITSYDQALTLSLAVLFPCSNPPNAKEFPRGSSCLLTVIHSCLICFSCSRNKNSLAFTIHSNNYSTPR